MNLVAKYSTEGVFSLGELRALIDQQKQIPDEATVRLVGDGRHPEDQEDSIKIEWDEA